VTHKYGNLGDVKTTLEIPDPLFRKVKSRAAERGQSLKDFVVEALHARLASERGASDEAPPWMAGFGKLKRLRKETARIQALVDTDLDVVEAEDRA
jgi:plasmid stability protein